MNKKKYMLLLINCLIIFGINFYLNYRLKEALNLSLLSKLRQDELTSKEQVWVSINQMNEIGFCINFVTVFSLVLFIINSIYLKYYSDKKYWLFKSIFFLFITFGVSILHIVLLINTHNN